MYYYGYQNYAAGVIGILVLAVALTALLVVLVLPKEKDGHLPSVFQMLYDLFSPKTLVMEKLLQILYVFLTCLAVLYGIVVFFSGFFSGFQNLALGLVILAVGPILLRVGYELILLLVMQVKTTREIHQKLTQMLKSPLRAILHRQRAMTRIMQGSQYMSTMNRLSTICSMKRKKRTRCLKAKVQNAGM